MPAGNHGSCENKHPAQGDEYNNHDSLQASLLKGIGHSNLYHSTGRPFVSIILFFIYIHLEIVSLVMVSTISQDYTPLFTLIKLHDSTPTNPDKYQLKLMSVLNLYMSLITHSVLARICN